ncbi:MAG TPA: thiolase family protein [Kofleriaceae bacterium]|jgi:acetyl-CoA acetyltransferase family protein|nr:thiolase family protein [Kofleriaceae bacterium]
MREAVIVASSRTPLAKSHRGSFNITRPDDLAAHAIRHAIAKVPRLDPGEVEEVILGCGQPHGPAGHNIARVAALRAGLPTSVAGLTVNRFCNSGLQSIVQAAHMVILEGVEAIIGGGVESITLMQRDASPNPWVVEHHPGVYMTMGDTAEVVAKRYNVSRAAQDEVSLVSQQRTARAQREGWFKDELAPMQVRRAVLDKKTGTPVGEEDAFVEADECNRPDTTLQGLAKLPPVFDTTSGQGSVTAGNSSQLSDGASATLLMSRERAQTVGAEPLLVFRGYAVSGCEPDEMGIGPVFSVPKLLKKHGLKVEDIDVWELNEAFASQVVYCRDQLGIPMERLNPNGGSISIGHPFGMTGSRLVGTLAYEMRRRNLRYGVVTMCVGGGQGGAALFERA